jgi:hypothetical protein
MKVKIKRLEELTAYELQQLAYKKLKIEIEWYNGIPYKVVWA